MASRTGHVLPPSHIGASKAIVPRRELIPEKGHLRRRLRYDIPAMPTGSGTSRPVGCIAGLSAVAGVTFMSVIASALGTATGLVELA